MRFCCCHSRRWIQATSTAFAAIRGDGSVVTWGDVEAGGDSSSVQGQLKDVHQIQASSWAFAAILFDGSIVTWVMRTLVVIAVKYKIS